MCDAWVGGGSWGSVFGPARRRRCSRPSDHDLGAITLCWQHYESVFRREIEKQVAARRSSMNTRLTPPPEPEEDTRPRFVYFAVTDEKPGKVKIGVSVNIESRMAALHARCIGFMPGGFAKEGELHHKFRQERLKKGEWFNLSNRISKYIEQNAISLVADLPERVDVRILPLSPDSEEAA